MNEMIAEIRTDSEQSAPKETKHPHDVHRDMIHRLQHDYEAMPDVFISDPAREAYYDREAGRPITEEQRQLIESEGVTAETIAEYNRNKFRRNWFGNVVATLYTIASNTGDTAITQRCEQLADEIRTSVFERSYAEKTPPGLVAQAEAALTEADGLLAQSRSETPEQLAPAA